MTEKTISVSFASLTKRIYEREWLTIPKFLAKLIITSQTSIRKSIDSKTIKKGDEDVWWRVIDINYDEELWMNNDDGEMVIINNEEDTAYYTNF